MEHVENVAGPFNALLRFDFFSFPMDFGSRGVATFTVGLHSAYGVNMLLGKRFLQLTTNFEFGLTHLSSCVCTFVVALKIEVPLPFFASFTLHHSGRVGNLLQQFFVPIAECFPVVAFEEWSVAFAALLPLHCAST